MRRGICSTFLRPAQRSGAQTAEYQMVQPSVRGSSVFPPPQIGLAPFFIVTRSGRDALPRTTARLGIPQNIGVTHLQTTSSAQV